MAVGRTNVRVVVVGDRGTGKSSLISAVASESFPDTVPHVLPPTRLSADTFPDGVPITIIDTSSSLESKGKLAEELKRADVVLLTYACDQPASLDHLGNFWLHEFRRLEVKVPVIVVGCKLDLRDERFPVSLDQIMAPVMQQFREIETCIECSAANLVQTLGVNMDIYAHDFCSEDYMPTLILLIMAPVMQQFRESETCIEVSAANLVQVPEVFYFAQKAVLHPTSPLFDQDTQALKPRCMRALKRIFVLCDQDMDGVLNDTELNEFQVKCFNTPLQPAEMVGVKRVVQEKLPEGVSEFGLTLTGFLFLHALFIEKGCLETTWTVLRKFGYDDTLNLREDQLSVPSTKAPDQTVELTSEAMEFLKGVFSLFDADKDGALRLPELEDLFSTAPESPWDESPYRDAAERSAFGGISLNGFLSEWALMTLLDPTKGLANLIYIGYTSHPASALRVTRRRSIDRKKQQTDRTVFQCFVFGPKGSGKSSLLKSFLGRPFMETTYSKSEERYVANIVDRPGRTKKILVLREIPEDGVKMLLEKKEAMSACDVAAFVYDGSDEYSLKRASELLMEVTKKGEETGFLVPSLLIAAKDDIDSYPLATKESSEICQDMGIDAPIHLSVKEGDLNNVFIRIVNAADRPNLNIPETEMGRKQKHFNQFVNRSIMLVSVGAAVVMVGLAAYRTYAARKNTSS